jgi:hypothetical protein
MTTMEKSLAIPNNDTTFFFSLDAIISELPAPLRPSAQAFKVNLDSVSRIITVPYRIVHLSILPEVEREVKDLIRQAVRQKGDGRTFAEAITAKAEALSRTSEHIEHVMLPGVRKKVIDRTSGALSDDQLAFDVQEIFLQSLVLAWGALEVLANDLFVVLLDSRPELSIRLMSSAPCERLFHNLKLDLKLLEAHKFNLASRMGQLLVDVHPIGTLEVMKVVFAALFGPSTVLQSSFGSKDLRLLHSRRNMIVHRRGYIDSEYIKNVGDNSLLLGTRLAVNIDDVRSSMEAVRDVVTCLLPAASSALTEDAG